MTFTDEQVAQILEQIKLTSGKRLSSKLDKALCKKGAKFNYENLMSTLSHGNADGLRPKKPPNAWQLFLREFREGDDVEPGMTGAEIVRKASPIWKKMTEDQKKSFKEEADKLSADYQKAKNAIKPVKVKSGLARPKNSWMLFLTEYRAEHKKEGVAGSAIVAEAGEVWKKMSEEEKKPFEDKANIAMSQYKSLKEGNGMLSKVVMPEPEEEESDDESDSDEDNVTQ